jgi:hypothetical protein|uniref:Hyaluronidase n=1 Tax=virus sp. ctmTa7 TaxID=2828255 RepID=A0A8S5RB89_9VIRU|nr:MAG TPA: hyaluronidase [virus sp. ctmTa7]
MAKTETDISTLKINYLSESAYKTALSNGEINENEIYMTPEQSDADTKVTNTLNTTTKAYVTGTTSSSTNTGTQIFDTGVYLDRIAGRLTATSFKVGNAVLTYNSSENTLIISFV